MVAAAGANFEDRFGALELERFRHERGHVGLRDGLSPADAGRRIAIRHHARFGRHKFFARNLEHGVQHARISNAAPAQLPFDHFTPFGGPIGYHLRPSSL